MSVRPIAPINIRPNSWPLPLVFSRRFVWVAVVVNKLVGGKGRSGDVGRVRQGVREVQGAEPGHRAGLARQAQRGETDRLISLPVLDKVTSGSSCVSAMVY